MKHSDFAIGKQFTCGGQRWQVTDVGSRVAIAIREKEDWMDGPPYAQPEIVFDEDDMPGCEELS